MTRFDLGGLCFSVTYSSVTYSSFSKCITLTVRLQLATHARIFACDHVIKITQYAPENPQLTPIFRWVSGCWNRQACSADETSWFPAFWREKHWVTWVTQTSVLTEKLRSNWCKNAAGKHFSGKRWSDPCSSVIKHICYFLLSAVFKRWWGFGSELATCRRLYIPCRTEFVWWRQSHRFDSRGVYGRWKIFDSVDLLPSDLLSDAPQLLCESGYKSDSSRYARRTSRNMLKLF